LIKSMLNLQNINIEISNDAVDWLAEISFDPHYGARPIKRNLQKLLVNELSKRILGNTINKTGIIYIDKSNYGLEFINK